METVSLADRVRDLCEKLGPGIEGEDKRIVAIAMVRNEEDVIERFVRHCLTWADALLVVDHASYDETSSILCKLAEEGLCVGIVSDDAVAKHQADRLTLLANAAAVHLKARVIVPLDADEFLTSDDQNVRACLNSLAADQAIFVHWWNYVPTPSDDAEEPDVLRRITYRCATPSKVTKVIFGGEIAKKNDFRISHGSHWLFSDGAQITGTAASSLHLAHFPVRSAGQITAKTLITPLAGLLDLERFPTAQTHYSILRDRAPIHSYMSPLELQRAAVNYGLFSGEFPADIVSDPLTDTSGALRYTPLNRVDAAYRFEAFARTLVERLLDHPAPATEPVALRELISAENDRLRLEVQSLTLQLTNVEQRLAALRRMRIFRIARWVRDIWKQRLARS